MKKSHRLKAMFLILTSLLLLMSACSGDSQSYSLKDQDGKEVTLPDSKPVVLFFFTTYT